MSITTTAQPVFGVDTFSELLTSWPNGSTAYVRSDGKTYTLNAGVWNLASRSFSGILAADVSTTLSTRIDVPGLSIPINAFGNVIFDYQLFIGCSGTGGVKITLTVPGGVTFKAGLLGTDLGSTASVASVLSTSGLKSIAFNSFNSAVGFLRVSGSALTDSATGNIQLGVACGTAGETSTIFANSSFSMRRV